MKLSYKKTIFVGLIFFSISLFWQVYDSIIPKILKNDFGFSKSLTGIIMAMDNVVALFMLPLFGHLSDKTNTRWGRRTPYIVCGTILAVLTFIFVGVFADNNSLAGFLITLGFVLIFMSVYRSPAVTLMPDVTIKPLRSKANAIINLLGALGGLLSLGSIAFLYKGNASIMPLFGVICGVMLIALIIFLLLVKEPVYVQQMQAEKLKYNLTEETEVKEKNQVPMEKAKLKSLILLLLSVFLWFMAYNSVTTFFSIYAEEVWGIADGEFTLPLMVAQVAAIAMFIPVGILASKIGRKKTILIGILTMIFSFAAAFFIGSNLFGINVDLSGGVFNNPIFYIMALFFMLTGAGWATINVNSYPMVVEMSKDSNSGKFTGFYYTASMAGQILTPVLAGLVMDYVSSKLLFLYAAIFISLAFLTMYFVKHGDSKPIQKSDKLESFDVDD
jgi:MFS family permease